MTNQRGSIATILVVIILLAVSVFGFYYLNKKSQPQESDTQMRELPSPLTNQKVASSSESMNNTVDWKTYQNQEYDFEFKYPAHYEEVEMVEKDANLFPYKTLVVEFVSKKEANTMAPESIYIYVTKPLKEYSYSNNSAGIAYKFDVAAKIWKGHDEGVPDPTGEIQKLMPKQLNPENTIYAINYPCGGGKGIAIPQSSDFVLELSVECMSSYPDSEEEQKNAAVIREIFGSVMSSFKFTN